VLAYRVKQLFVEGQNRYFLPLPKLNEDQLTFLADDLVRRGFKVRRGAGLGARNGAFSLRVTPDGLAWSSSVELLDAIAPAVPRLLQFPRRRSQTNPYYAVKKRGEGYDVQMFMRLESLARWSALRRADESGLTPDEAVVIGGLMSGARSEIPCVTDYPVDGSTPFQAGHHQYYSSKVSSDDFVSRLRTLGKRHATNCYIPRNSILRVVKGSIQVGKWSSDRLGEWCYLDIRPQNL
jgi:hypothetical protein